MPAMSRTFLVPISDSNKAQIIIHEPSLTADNLGHKTWAASYLLAKRLHLLAAPAPSTPSSGDNVRKLRILELGAGTGLVGLAAAAVWPHAEVHLTDVQAIIDNLRDNVGANHAAAGAARRITTGVLDWSEHLSAGDAAKDQGFDLILAADVLYADSLPALLVPTIQQHLRKGPDARVVVEVPCRPGYSVELDAFKAGMCRENGLLLVDQGFEDGWDDWGSPSHDSAEAHAGQIRCWWGEWTRGVLLARKC